MKISTIGILLMGLWGWAVNAQPFDALTLWDDRPATDWMTQYYPIGNGRMGAMLSGGTTQDHIQFNEQSLWTGDEQETGAYQAFGDVYIDFDGPSPIQAYSRSLHLRDASHHVAYRSNGHTFRRLGFASHPDNVLVFTYGADTEGAYSGRIRLVDAHGAVVSGREDALYFDGRLENGLHYAASLAVRHIGGSVCLKEDADHGYSLVFEQVDAFTLYLVASTDYRPVRSDGWRGGDPVAKNKQTLDNALGKSDEELFQAHVADYQGLFGRFDLRIGGEHGARETTTSQRVVDYQQKADPGLEVLLVQYGRYLLISSSRAGGLP